MHRTTVAAAFVVSACTAEVPLADEPPHVADPPVVAPSPPAAIPVRGSFEKILGWNGISFDMTCDGAKVQLDARNIAYERSWIRRYPRRREGQRIAHTNEPLLLVDTAEGRWSIRCNNSKRVRTIRFNSEDLTLTDTQGLVARIVERYGPPHDQQGDDASNVRVWTNDQWHTRLFVTAGPVPGRFRVEQVFVRGPYTPVDAP